MRKVWHVFVVALASAVISGGAALAFDAGTAAAIDNAADAFVAMAGDSANTGKVPRQTDAAAKPLLDRVFDTSEIQHGVQPISALADLSKWTMAVVKVGTVYTLAGAGISKLEGVPNDPAILEKLNHNAVVFPTEMGRLPQCGWKRLSSILSWRFYLRLPKPSSNAPKTESLRFEGVLVRRLRASLLRCRPAALPMNGVENDWRFWL